MNIKNIAKAAGLIALGALGGQIVNVKLQDRAMAKWRAERAARQGDDYVQYDLAPLDVESAKERFADIIEIDCPLEECDKKAGDLCDTPGVWVHVERINAVRPL